MKIDRTGGKEPRYMVSIYRWNVSDYFYYHTYKEAKAFYDKVKDTEQGIISLYDIKKDIRKEYTRKEAETCSQM